jgi:glutathione synthase/RimK-type ligase-like ATP-grasp enzyme
VLNHWASVLTARDKILTFNCLKENSISIPEYTEDKAVAQSWDGVVVCRKTVTGQEGQGIVIAQTPDEIVDAPLYTKHVRHKHEFRVHVFKGSVIDFTQKKKRADVEVDNFVRNSAGNWVFCRDGVVLPDDVALQAVNAVSALGLDFGAVDVAYRERENKAFVLEVNTAAGLEGTTLERYTQAFKSYMETL